jgi:hypothetical protein
MVVPTWLIVEHGYAAGRLTAAQALHAAWWCLTGYVTALGLAIVARYRGGKWRRMSVREAPVAVPQAAPTA